MILLSLILPTKGRTEPELSSKPNVFTVQNGESMFLEASNKYLNNITLNFDPVVVCLDLSHFKHNVRNKTVFFLASQQTSFSIVNKSGEVIINITVIPKDMPGKLYFINIPNLNLNDAIQFEQTNSYEKIVITLIDSMYNQTPLPGYSVIKNPSQYDFQITNIKGLFILPVLIYQGVKFQVIKIQINNLDRTEKELFEHEIYSKNIRACALDANIIEGQSEIFGYIVHSNENLHD